MKHKRLILILICAAVLLSAGIGWMVLGSGLPLRGERQVRSSRVKNLDIRWSAGSVTVYHDDIEKIAISVADAGKDAPSPTYTVAGGTLRLNYGGSADASTLPAKDLTIILPYGFICESMVIRGSSLNIQLTTGVDRFTLEGTDNDLNFAGSAGDVAIEGDANYVRFYCDLMSAPPEQIALNGAACSLNLTVPQFCGFLVVPDQTGCSFTSDVDYQVEDGCYRYRLAATTIYVNGIDCDVTIYENPFIVN